MKAERRLLDETEFAQLEQAVTAPKVAQFDRWIGFARFPSSAHGLLCVSSSGRDVHR
jgi:hypothetical protein